MEQSQFNNLETQQKLPNATAVLIMGIISLFGCCCYGILGLIVGIIGLVIAKKDMAMYRANPSLYTNYQNLNIGKVLCIIGIILGVIALVFFAWIISVIGIENLQNEDLVRIKMEEYFNK